MKRDQAVRCCNEAMYQAEVKKKKASIDRAKGNIRIRLGKDYDKHFTAIGSCPKRGCKAERAVRLRLERWDDRKAKRVRIPVSVALKKAKGLVVAQLVRHMRTWACG